MGSQLRELTRLVKKEWPHVHKELGYAPPVHRTDCGTRLALTASNYKYLEKLRYKIQALVKSCWQSLQEKSTRTEAIAAQMPESERDPASESMCVEETEPIDSESLSAASMCVEKKLNR